MATLALGIVGAAIGSAIPGVGTAWGWTIGTILGGMLFPPRLPGQGAGPMDDLKLGGSTYGSPIPICYGTNTLGGELIWTTEKIPHEINSSMKGKSAPGGPQYTYSASFAFMFGEGPIEGFEKIWFGDVLVWDAGESEYSIETYLGDFVQLPDPTIEEQEGIGSTPAYRGRVYFAANGVPLDLWGGGLPTARALLRQSSDRFTEFDWSSGEAVMVRKHDDTLWIGGTFGGNDITQVATDVRRSAFLKSSEMTALYVANDGQLFGRGSANGGGSSTGSLFGNGINTGTAGSFVNTFGGNPLPNFGEGVLDLVGLVGTAFVIKADKTLQHMGEGGGSFFPAYSYRGDGSTTDTLTPTQVATGVIQVTMAAGGPMILKDDFTVEVSGQGGGWMGRNSTTNLTTFAASLISDVAFIARRPNAGGGNDAAFAVTNAGRLYACGNNFSNHLGQVALGTGDVLTWQEIDLGLEAGVTVIAVAVSGQGAAALDSLFRVHAWGEAHQAGQGITTGRIDPAIVATNCRALGNSENALFAITFDDDVVAWGHGIGFQRGDNSTASLSVPTLMPWGVSSSFVDLKYVMDNLAGRLKIDADHFDYEGGVNIPVRGYALTHRNETRALISPLLEIMNVDHVNYDGKLQLVQRGRAIDHTILAGDLGAHSWEERENPPRPIEKNRMHGLDLPAVLDLAYYSHNADHRQATQSAIRFDRNNFVDRVTYNSSIVLTDDEAALAAWQRLWVTWSDAQSFEIRLSHKWFKIAPADTLLVPDGDATIRMRVEDIKYAPLGYMKLSCRLDNPKDLEHYVTGQPVEPPSERRHGDLDPADLELRVWSGNAAIDDHATRHDVYIAWTERSGINSNWVVVIEMSEDNMVTWDVVRVIPPFGAGVLAKQPLGTATSALAAPDPDTSGLVDDVNTVDVAIYGGTPSSVSIDDMITDNLNMAFLGDEIINFATVEALGPNSFRLSNLLRGQRGTDWAWGNHAIGDRFILAREGTAGWGAPVEPFHRSEMEAASMPIGAEYDWRITYGSLLGGGGVAGDSVENVVVEGYELFPYSVVDVEGVRDGGNDLTITWVRRARTLGHLAAWQDVPLGEAVEAYQIDILDGVVVVRTIDTAVESAEYTAAEQTADGLTPGDPITMNIYQIGSVGRGFPARGNALMAVDPLLGFTTLEVSQAHKEATIATALAILSRAAAGVHTVTATSGTTVLTAAQSENGLIRATGVLVGNLTITLAAAHDNGQRIVSNETTGAFTVSVQFSGGAAAQAVTQGEAAIFIDGDLILMGGGGSGAPTDASYIVQTPNGTLSAEQALSALATGLVKNTTTTGVLSIGVANTDYADATHASRHQNGGADEVSVAGLSGLLADGQTPLAHATTHQNGGADEISVAGLSGLLADAQAPLAHLHSLADIVDEGALASLNTVGSAQINNAAVTHAKLADLTGPVVIGKDTGTGVPESIGIGAGLDIDAGTLKATDASATAKGIVELATDEEVAASVVVQANDFRLNGRDHIVEKDDDYTVLTTDLHTIFTNRTAAKNIVLTLPPAPLDGEVHEFNHMQATATYTLAVTANTGQFIRIGHFITLAAGNVSSSEPGAYIALKYHADILTWVAVCATRLWTVSNSTNYQAGQTPFDIQDHLRKPTACIAETLRRVGEVINVSHAALTTQREFHQLIALTEGTVITSVSFFSAGTGAGTPLNWWFTLRSLARVLLRQTADQTTTAWAGGTKKTLNLSSQYTIPMTGLYYVGVMVNATTVPTMEGFAGRANINSEAPITSGNSGDTGLTTTAPATSQVLAGNAISLYAQVA